jgi:hypothetical protein
MEKKIQKDMGSQPAFYFDIIFDIKHRKSCIF